MLVDYAVDCCFARELDLIDTAEGNTFFSQVAVRLLAQKDEQDFPLDVLLPSGLKQYYMKD